jgi:elongation factor Tu
MELKELLKKHEYDPDTIKFVKGSALHAINDTEPELGEKSIIELLDVMDNHIPLPARPIDKPFMMSIEGTYNIEGRGAVATGTVEQGKVKIGDEVELVGYTATGTKATITGIETFNKTLDTGEAGDNIGVLIRGFTREQLYRGKQ